MLRSQWVLLFYGYCIHICINPAFTLCFDLKTQLFNIFLHAEIRWGDFFTQWNYYDFSKWGIHSVYVCVAFTLGDPMAQLVWRWSCQRWQTAGGGSNPCWSTRESQVRPAARQRAPTKKKKCCVYIGQNFWGDFWGWMGCGVPCGRASAVHYRGPLYPMLVRIRCLRWRSPSRSTWQCIG